MAVITFGHADELRAEVLLLRTLLGKWNRGTRDLKHNARSRRQVPLNGEQRTAYANVQGRCELNELFTIWLNPAHKHRDCQGQSFPTTTILAALNRFHPWSYYAYHSPIVKGLSALKDKDLFTIFTGFSTEAPIRSAACCNNMKFCYHSP